MSEQIKVTVIAGKNKNTTELFHDKEMALLHTLREGGIILPSLCGSMGKCGGCLVRFYGYAPLPAQADRAMLAPDKLRQGYRLACTARPKKDCMVETAFVEEREIDVVDEYDGKREVWAKELCSGRKESGIRKKESGIEKKESGTRIAVAVDIGTTTIAMQMIEAGTGRILDTYTCLNPQKRYGMEVISRIQASIEGHGKMLQRLLREALAIGIGHMKKNAASRAESGIEGRVVCIVISANTVMGHLFMGYPMETLGKSPFLPVNIGTAALDYLGIPTVLVSGISAFVGGDVVSGLYACGLCRQQSGKAWLFLDLGTNAEMVMGNGGRIVCTAAAAGPAFEGRGRDGATGAERITAIAHLLEKGIIDSTGLLEEPYFETGIEVTIAEKKNIERKIRIFKEDIRDIQMAKAAVRAGIHFLMEHLSMEDYEEIEKVYIAGGFGFYLDKKAAVRVGLIPPELEGKIETVGNTSLAGACLLGEKISSKCEGTADTLDMEALDRLEEFARKAEAFQLAREPEFEKAYIDAMEFNI